MMDWLDRLLFLVRYRAEQRTTRRKKRKLDRNVRRLSRALGRLGKAVGIPSIHETGRGGSTSPQEAEMNDGAGQATQKPTDAEAEAAEAAAAVARTDERAEQAVAATEIPEIVVHYLGFTLKRIDLPTGHFPTKAKLIEAIEPAILNKGWNIGSKDLDQSKLPEIGCHREKAKAIAAALRAAKAAAPCRLVILDSNGEEVESRTLRQPAEADSGE